MIPHLLLAALFLLTIAHLVTLKICSVALDHRTAPLYIGGWTLAGLIFVAPLYGHLAVEGFAAFMAHPFLLALVLLKSGLLYVLLVVSQELMKESLSSRHYVTPMAVGFIAAVNFLLGEELNWSQWTSALGLCALSAAFFFRGHASSLSKGGRLAYVKLVALSVAIAAIDHTALGGVNWYALLLAGNIALLLIGAVHLKGRIDIARAALLSKPAALAGFCYAATELVKYYQMVSINPVTAIAAVQAATKPVILALSAIVWKERSLKEQAAWGLAAFGFTVLAILF